MNLCTDLQHDICALFDVSPTENGGWSVVTPMQYSGSNDHVVVHVKPTTQGWELHDNGDAVLNANLLGFDTGTDAMDRWTDDLPGTSPVAFSHETERLTASTLDGRLLAPYIFRVAEAAQQMFAISTQRHDRRSSNLREQVSEVVIEVASLLNKVVSFDAPLPIAGDLKADVVVEGPSPLIVIAATSSARLLEAEIIFMQMRHKKMPGFVLAIAESAQTVGRKQFDRANFYTDKTVGFDRMHLVDLIKDCLER